MARGFVCEICRSREIIFPWDVTRIVRCRHCGCCLHMVCWKGSHTPATSPGLASPDDCPRCIRLRARHSYRDNSEA
jgi:run domain Beclin-1 interacting cysteine-rich containing protein